jgi:hypothetical protein
VLNGRITDELEGIQKKAAAALPRYYSAHFLREIRKITLNLSQDVR